MEKDPTSPTSACDEEITPAIEDYSNSPTILRHLESPSAIEEDPSDEIPGADYLSKGFVRNHLWRVDKTATISSDAAALVRAIAARFIKTVTDETIKAARLRKSSSIQKQDVYFALHSCGLNIPGSIVVPSRTITTPACAERLAAVKKFLVTLRDD
jgi:histone H3/H4